MIRDQKQQFS